MSLEPEDYILFSALAAVIRGKAHVVGVRSEHRMTSADRREVRYDIDLSSTLSFNRADTNDYKTVVGYLLGFTDVSDENLILVMKSKLELPKNTETEAVCERAAIYFGNRLKMIEGK